MHSLCGWKTFQSCFYQKIVRCICFDFLQCSKLRKKMPFLTNKEFVFFFYWEILVTKFVDLYSENSWKHVVSSIIVKNLFLICERHLSETLHKRDIPKTLSAATKVNSKALLKVSNVLGSSSIWTCRISNICCCLLQAGWLEKIKTNIQYSKFDTSKLMSYQGHEIPNPKLWKMEQYVHVRALPGKFSYHFCERFSCSWQKNYQKCHQTAIYESQIFKIFFTKLKTPWNGKNCVF